VQPTTVAGVVVAARAIAAVGLYSYTHCCSSLVLALSKWE